MDGPIVNGPPGWRTSGVALATRSGFGGSGSLPLPPPLPPTLPPPLPAAARGWPPPADHPYLGWGQPWVIQFQYFWIFQKPKIDF